MCLHVNHLYISVCSDINSPVVDRNTSTFISYVVVRISTSSIAEGCLGVYDFSSKTVCSGFAGYSPNRSLLLLLLLFVQVLILLLLLIILLLLLLLLLVLLLLPLRLLLLLLSLGYCGRRRHCAVNWHRHWHNNDNNKSNVTDRVRFVSNNHAHIVSKKRYWYQAWQMEYKLFSNTLSVADGIWII